MTHPLDQVLSLNDLAGRRAIITGGTGKIGTAIVASLAANGAEVITGSSNPENVSTAGELWSQTDNVTVVEMDVTSKKGIVDALKGGDCHILVNCAGGNLKKPLTKTTDEDFDRIVNLNLRAAFRASRDFSAHAMQHGNGGVIINICSVTTFQALQGVLVYGITKCGLWGLTMQMAADDTQMAAGIRAVAVAPGFVKATQNASVVTPDRNRRIVEGTPMGRWGLPEEIAGAVTFLSSNAARFINGSCISVDGGYMTAGLTNVIVEDE